MPQIKKLESIVPLSTLKNQYMAKTTAPLDGMWLCGFVPMARHFGLYKDDELIGFFCVNDEGYLLQFFVQPDYQSQSSLLFESVLQGNHSQIGSINGAFVSTAEPDYLSLCLDGFSKFDVHSLMYQRSGAALRQRTYHTLALTKIYSEQLSQAVDFAVASIGAPAQWLTGYFGNLIKRQELFGVWEHERLVATGEIRGYDEFQKDYADLGVIVAESERGKGLATQVLCQLADMNEASGLKSICSTEWGNIGAQKAIGRAGFFASNRIAQFQA